MIADSPVLTLYIVVTGWVGTKPETDKAPNAYCSASLLTHSELFECLALGKGEEPL